jgi:AcrR family transcriptional regulator
MAISTRVRDAAARKARAERILDATADLLLRLGYKRVTIDDVAAQADVGKGTIYLHWPTREALFYAVLVRESLAVIDEMISAIRQDPEAVLLHRLAHTQFLVVMRRPLIRAVFTGDLEVLGTVVRTSDPAITVAKKLATEAYLRVLQESHCVRTDLSVEELTYAVGCSLSGFYLLEPINSTLGYDLTLERKADLVASTLKHAFEPPGPLSPETIRAAATRMVEILTEAADRYTTQLQRAYA